MKKHYSQPELYTSELVKGSILLASQEQWGDNDGNWPEEWNS